VTAQALVIRNGTLIDGSQVIDASLKEPVLAG
jgi:hypothetical protein